MALWEATADGMHASADYLSTHQWKVIVTKDGITEAETIPAIYEPRFGIDIDDMRAISETAERLANKIETKPC